MATAVAHSSPTASSPVAPARRYGSHTKNRVSADDSKKESCASIWPPLTDGWIEKMASWDRSKKTYGVEINGDPVCLARRQSRVGRGKIPSHRCPTTSTVCRNLSSVRTIWKPPLNRFVRQKHPNWKCTSRSAYFVDPPFPTGIPLRSYRKGWEDPPPMTVHRN